MLLYLSEKFYPCKDDKSDGFEILCEEIGDDLKPHLLGVTVRTTLLYTVVKAERMKTNMSKGTSLNMSIEHEHEHEHDQGEVA